jgi:hypothetical protein
MWRKTITAAAILATGLALTACDLIKPDKGADAAARKAIDEAASGADLSKDPAVDAGLGTAESTAELGQIHAAFPAGGKPTIKSVGWSINAKAGEPTHAELGYVYTYPDRTLDMHVVLKKNGEKAPWIVTGLQLQREGGKDGPVVAGEQPAVKKDGE